MDVPTRQAYVVAVVDPDERTAATAYTNGARHVARPVAPLLTGSLLTVSVGAPFVVAGALKSVYDAGLYALFRDVHPPAPPRVASLPTADRESIVSSPARAD
jgi:hypothetical protein